MFDDSDGVETDMAAGLPSGFEAVLDIEGDDFDDDYRLSDEEPRAVQTPGEAPAPKFQGKGVKAYLVTCTSYNTCVGGSDM